MKIGPAPHHTRIDSSIHPKPDMKRIEASPRTRKKSRYVVLVSSVVLVCILLVSYIHGQIKSTTGEDGLTKQELWESRIHDLHQRNERARKERQAWADTDTTGRREAELRREIDHTEWLSSFVDLDDWRSLLLRADLDCGLRLAPDAVTTLFKMPATKFKHHLSLAAEAAARNITGSKDCMTRSAGEKSDCPLELRLLRARRRLEACYVGKYKAVEQAWDQLHKFEVVRNSLWTRLTISLPELWKTGAITVPCETPEEAYWRYEKRCSELYAEVVDLEFLEEVRESHRRARRDLARDDSGSGSQ